jgi:hypothetical protein
MFDAGKVIIGLVIFLVLITFPVWYNATIGNASYVPDPQIITTAPACVAPTAYMKASHMDLLNQWRDDVVRRGNREYVAADGTVYNKSLTKTCMDCHSNKAEFCDRCHDYVAVGQPDCWDCHIAPEGGAR